MIEYEEDWLFTLIFKYRGAVIYKACYFAVPSALLTLAFLCLDDYAPDFREEANLMNLGGSTIWSAAGAALVFAIGFRTNRGILRFWEGTGLLHQMRGEWFDTVSNCVSFSIKAARDERKQQRVTEFRHTLVRLMSLCHGYALEEISGDVFEIATINVHGLDRATRRYLKECNETYKFNKVEMTLHLIQSLIVDAHQTGIIDIPAPILSRVFQTISRGFVHLLNTKKITDTKFPFPYTQLIAILLIIASVLTPMLISSFIVNKVVAAMLTFIPIFAMAALNYIAIEIENPFGRDDNDLPMDHFQKEMDSCLLMLLHPFADTIPTTGYSCIYDFQELERQFGNSQPKEDLEEDCASPKQQKHALRRWDTQLLKLDGPLVPPPLSETLCDANRHSSGSDIDKAPLDVDAKYLGEPFHIGLPKNEHINISTAFQVASTKIDACSRTVCSNGHGISIAGSVNDLQEDSIQELQQVSESDTRKRPDQVHHKTNHDREDKAIHML